MSTARPFKTCTCCLADLTLAEWLSLPLIARHALAEGEPVLEYRNHGCGSTICIELPAKPVRKPTLLGIPLPAAGSCPTPTRAVTPYPTAYSFVSRAS